MKQDSQVDVFDDYCLLILKMGLPFLLVSLKKPIANPVLYDTDRKLTEAVSRTGRGDIEHNSDLH